MEKEIIKTGRKGPCQDGGILLTLVFSLLSAVLSAFLFSLTGLYTVWYWYFIPILLFFPLYLGFFLLYVLLLVLIGLFVNKKKPVDKPNRFFYAICVVTLRQLFFLMRVKVEVKGAEKLPKGEFLLVYNHVSNFDPLLLLVGMPVPRLVLVSKPENERIPLVGRYMHMSGFLTIDRVSPMRARATVEKCVDWIGRGVASVAISPEGTRSKTGELLPFRAAPFSIARKAEVPVVVTVLKNTGKIAKNAPFRRTAVRVEVVDLVMPETFRELTSFEMSEQVRAIMLKGLEKKGEDEERDKRENGKKPVS